MTGLEVEGVVAISGEGDVHRLACLALSRGRKPERPLQGEGLPSPCQAVPVRLQFSSQIGRGGRP